MYRTLRPRVGITSLSSRIALRPYSVASRNARPTERVHFKRPLFRPKAIMSGLLAFGICYGIFTAVVLSPLDKYAEEIEKNMDEETRKELEEQGGNSIFIPFPGTTKQIQPPPYRGSDPEWQEYIKFSKDPALGKMVRDELADFIKQTVKKHPVLVMRCGNDIKLRRYWLDVVFPYAPPPEFERSGIEIADDYIAWTTMPVDSLTVFRIRQALWPSALTQSLWSFSKVLIKQDTATIAGMLGIQSKPEPSIETIVTEHKTGPVTEPGKSEQLDDDPSPPSQPATHDFEEAARPDPEGAVDKPPSDVFKALAKRIKEADMQANQEGKHDVLTPIKMHLMVALTAFQNKFAQTWRPARSYPPRGSILVSGLIELDSPKAWLVMDVKAAWDPKTKEYHPRSMQVVMRRFQVKKQAPLGGR